MKTVNRIVLVGTIARDPEALELLGEDEGIVVNAAMSTERPEPGHQRDWHRIEFEGEQAEYVRQYVRQGTRLYVEGRVRYGSYDRDGVEVPITDIVARDFVVLGGPKGADDA